MVSIHSNPNEIDSSVSQPESAKLHILWLVGSDSLKLKPTAREHCNTKPVRIASLSHTRSASSVCDHNLSCKQREAPFIINVIFLDNRWDFFWGDGRQCWWYFADALSEKKFKYIMWIRRLWASRRANALACSILLTSTTGTNVTSVRYFWEIFIVIFGNVGLWWLSCVWSMYTWLT